jgi:opacity protein-like surface antigen
MKTVLYRFLMTLVVLLPVASHAQLWTGNVNALLGRKTLEAEDWKPVDKHVELGMLLDFKRDTWPVSVAIDFSWSDDGALEDNPFTGPADADGETTEVNLGVRKIWDHYARARPYIGGGVALISADIFVRVLGVRVSDSDDGQGFWAAGGLFWTLGDHFNVGLDVRYSQADITLFEVDADAGGTHVRGFLGYHW